jgi:hypothetical protein
MALRSRCRGRSRASTSTTSRPCTAFFEEGFVAYTVDQGGSDAPRPIPESVTRLWTGARPCADDLVRQMERPEQVMRVISLYGRIGRAFPISQKLDVAAIVVRRLASTTESLAQDLGMEEEALKASIGATARPGS